ncbi:MAG: sigma-70 family RNA polymerase sigma factor [Rhodothermales bacterium]
MQYDGLVTQLLVEHQNGNKEAADKLFELVYDELRGMARRELHFRSPGKTINTTGLVHEAYLKMFDRSDATWNDRVHFFSVTAKAMRQILVDYARRVKAKKRGGDVEHTELNASIISGSETPIDILDLDDAMKRLEEMNPRLSQIVECRYFGGMSIEETAALLDVSTRTVDRDWLKAKAFLYMALRGEV